MDFKFTISELETISHIDDSPTMSKLAIRMGVTKGYISRIVASLIQKGLVDISTNGISKNLTLTSGMPPSTRRQPPASLTF